MSRVRLRSVWARLRSVHCVWRLASMAVQMAPMPVATPPTAMIRVRNVSIARSLRHVAGLRMSATAPDASLICQENKTGRKVPHVACLLPH